MDDIVLRAEGLSKHYGRFAALESLNLEVKKGEVPRLTSAIVYGVIAWSFLIQMVGSLLNLDHWILDTSMLHHVPLVPAVEPNWTPVIALASIGLAASCVDLAF